ncbi:ion transporter [Saccharopolyspora flava]|uniref:Ion transport protein n=1 Tax=Saccharopolyspora flava TaxID=95161 RepID=A0A1I6QIU1_9PSEU|nr:ion transporter [Saccharopolyspora flava]SFS52275.1 hypothetical protein SAMN05660874_01491 [Saccharopolyspora flava]
MTSAIAAPRRTTAVDLSMLVLAVFSLGLLCYAMFVDTSPETAHAVFVIDTVICGVFFVEFLWRWRGTGWKLRFPLTSWYEILGMIPVAHPALRGFRLLRIVVVVMRLARTADRAFGERVTQRVIEKFSRPIVLAIKKPITVAVLDEVVKVVETGHYPENVARSLGEHREVLREIVTEKLKNDQQVGRIKHLPFHDEIVKSIVDTTIRVILDVLNDERTDQFFTEVVRENRDQIRRSVQLGLHESDHDDAEPPSDPNAYRAEYQRK